MKKNRILTTPQNKDQLFYYNDQKCEGRKIVLTTEGYLYVYKGNSGGMVQLSADEAVELGQKLVEFGSKSL